MIFIGVDPGLSGAIAAIGYVENAWDMPTQPWGKAGKRAVDLAAIVATVKHLDVLDRCVVLIERVSAMPGQGVTSMFSLGMSMYGVAGVFTGMGWPVQFVQPQAWKKHYGLDADKNRARAKAQGFYSHIDLSKKKHHGRAEALLIARYAQETYKA